MIALLLALFDARAQDPVDPVEGEEPTLEPAGLPLEDAVEDAVEDTVADPSEELDAEIPEAPEVPTVTPVAERLSPFARRPGAERGTHKIRGLPLRFDVGTAFRTEVAPGAVLGMGAQLARTKRFALETNVAFQPLHGLQYAGPWRTMGAWDFGADATWLAGRWLALGPSGGVAYRMFSQQGSAIEQMFVPVVGGRFNVAFLRARTWSFAITTRVVSDSSLTRIVLETNQVRVLPLVEGQVGLRFNLGHGKIPGESK